MQRYGSHDRAIFHQFEWAMTKPRKPAAVRIDRRSATSIHQQLYDRIRTRHRGQIAQSDRLTSALPQSRPTQRKCFIVGKVIFPAPIG
jgi:hypothetical protein